LFLALGVHCRVAALIMGQAGDVNPVPVAAVGHGRDPVVIRFIGKVVFPGNGRFAPVDDFDLVLARDDDPFIHVPDGFIGQ